MIKIPLARVAWAQVIHAGGDTNKTLTAKAGVRLWYLGHGVLVECDGKPDVLVPIAQVLTIEAAGGNWVEDSAGGGRVDAPDTGAGQPYASGPSTAGASPAPPTIAYTQMVQIPEGQLAPKKRGPGRPPKVRT